MPDWFEDHLIVENCDACGLSEDSTLRQVIIEKILEGETKDA